MLGKRARQDDCLDNVRVKRKRHSSLRLAAFSDEIILHILRLLPVEDICTVQLLNRHFARLTTDSILWRTLYRSDFSNRRKNNKKLNVDSAESPLERMRHLGVVNRSDLSPAHSIDWKRRYRIRLNWSKGRCRTHDDNASTTFVQAVNARRIVVAPGVLHIDGERHELAALEESDRAVEAGPDRLLLTTRGFVHVYDILSRTVLHTISSSNYQEVFYLNDFLVILTSTQSILVYDLHGSTRLIKLLNGLSSSKPIVTLRSMGGTTIVGLVFMSYGLLSSSLQVQELILSNAARSLSFSRLVRSTDFPNKPFHRGATSEDSAIAYEHPYVSISHGNYLILFTITSTPETIVLSEPRILQGYGATVKSCRINKSLRFVVGSGEAGLRLWDLNDDDRGVSATDRQHAVVMEFLGNPVSAQYQTSHVPSGVISTLSNDAVVTSNDEGQLRIHNFDI